jgi:hypothetical protein
MRIAQATLGLLKDRCRAWVFHLITVHIVERIAAEELALSSPDAMAHPGVTEAQQH